MSAKNSCTFFLIIDRRSLWFTPSSVRINPAYGHRERGVVTWNVVTSQWRGRGDGGGVTHQGNQYKKRGGRGRGVGGREREKGSRNRMFCYIHLLGLLMLNQSSVPLWYWQPESSTNHQNEVLGTAINDSDDPGTAWPLTQMQHLDGILPLPTEILGDCSGVKQRVHNNPTNPFSYLSVLLGYHSSVNITETHVCVLGHTTWFQLHQLTFL